MNRFLFLSLILSLFFGLSACSHMSQTRKPASAILQAESDNIEARIKWTLLKDLSLRSINENNHLLQVVIRDGQMKVSPVNKMPKSGPYCYISFVYDHKKSTLEKGQTFFTTNSYSTSSETLPPRFVMFGVETGEDTSFNIRSFSCHNLKNFNLEEIQNSILKDAVKIEF